MISLDKKLQVIVPFAVRLDSANLRKKDRSVQAMVAGLDSQLAPILASFNSNKELLNKAGLCRFLIQNITR
jgi:hypothetical protein